MSALYLKEEQRKANRDVQRRQFIVCNRKKKEKERKEKLLNKD